MQTVAQCNLTAMGGRVVILTAIREGAKVTFTGGNHGDHSINANSSDERMRAHFEGYCENRADGGLWSLTYYYY